jgi:hopanoid C-3 methylase
VKFLLVRSRQPAETIGLQHLMVVEPLELEVIGALVAPPDEVVLVDLMLEQEPLEAFLARERPDVVGFTGYITNVGVLCDLAGRVKRWSPRATTVVGGPHAEMNPQDFNVPAIDFRVARNATTEFPRLVAHLKGEGPLPAGVLAAGQALEEARMPAFDFTYPTPRRDLTARYRHRYFYLYQDHVALVKASFGCPFTCSFCACRALTHGQYATRPLDDVLDEIAALAEDEVYIVDDDFLISRERVLAFVAGLERRGVRKRFQVYGRADFIAANPDVIARFRAAGLTVVIVGLESFSDTELVQYGKRAEAAANVRAMEVLEAHHIDVYATFILSPDWDRSDFARLDRFMSDLHIRFANLQPLTPLPGVEYQVEDARLVERRTDWAMWDLAHVTVWPTRLAVADFYAETMRLYRRMIWRPRNLWKNRKYPLHMQWRILRGLARIDRQYRSAHRDALARA